MDSFFLSNIKKSKKEDKSHFLKVQKEAKEEREKIKHQEKCATKIKALYMGYKARAMLLQELSTDLRKKLSDVMKLKDKLPPSQFSLIANKVYFFLKFFDPFLAFPI